MFYVHFKPCAILRMTFFKWWGKSVDGNPVAAEFCSAC